MSSITCRKAGGMSLCFEICGKLSEAGTGYPDRRELSAGEAEVDLAIGPRSDCARWLSDSTEV
jgi:hypothetical protein